MSKLIFFVGYVRQEYLNYFLENNYTVGVIKDTNNPYVAQSQSNEVLKQLDMVIPIDFSSQKTIAEGLKGVFLKPETVLVTLFDRFLLASSYIADALNLNQKNYIPPTLGRNATNKLYQRKEFQKHFPEITPEFKKFKTFHGAYLFTRKHGFPVIIKPANLSQSQLVNVCTNLEDLIKKASYVLDHVAEVYKKNKVTRTPQVGIEKYIEGQQYSVDSYAGIDGKIVHTPICTQTIGYDAGLDNFETLHSDYTDDLSKKEQTIIYDTVTKAIQSLDIKGNPTHTEVRLNKDGECKIVEVNIRTGAYRPELLKYSFGINHPQNVINTYLGLPVEVPTKLLEYSSCPQFWSKKIGKLKFIEGLDEIEKLPSFKKKIVFVNEGEKVGPADLGFSKGGVIILSNPDKEILQNDLAIVREKVKMVVEEEKSMEVDTDEWE